MTSFDGGQANRGTSNHDEATHRHIVADFPALCISVVRPDGSTISAMVGEAYADVSGYDVEELESDPSLWSKVIHPEDSERVRQAHNRLAAGDALHEHYRIYRKDGQMRHVLETGVAAEPAEVGRLLLRWMTDVSAGQSAAESGICFHELVDEAPVGISVRDLDGHVLYCNLAYARMFGYESPAEMIGTDFREIMSPAKLEEFTAEIFPRVLTGAWSGDVTVHTKDGELLQLRLSTNVFRGPDGTPVAAYALVLDITELKETEKALRENRVLLKAIQDSIPANLAVIDMEGTIIAVNERWRNFARGNGDPDLTQTCEGVNYLEVCRRAEGPMSEGADVVLAGLQAILDGRSTEFETEYPCPAPGYSRWFFMRASPLRGEQPGAVVAHFDISRRKRIEEALRKSEARYHSLLENLDAVVFRMGAEMQLLAITGRVEAMLGYDRDELMASSSLWRDVVHPDDAAKATEMMERARASRSPQWIEIRVTHRSGRVVWIRGTLTPIFDDKDQFAYYDGVSLDITERVEAQERDARHTNRMRVLTEMIQQCGSTLESRNILDTVTQQVCRTLDCVSAGVNIDPLSGRVLNLSLCCPRGCNIEKLDREIRRVDLCPERVFEAMDAVPRIIPDLLRSSPALAGFAKIGGLGAGMVAPVVAGEEVVGVLLAARVNGEQFDEEDLWFLTEAAAHSSAALANSAVYRRQAMIAETLQRTLVPPEPAISFLDIATLYAPAPGEARVGGDFFDVFRVEGSKAALVVGDVSGKGVEAAIHTAEAKYMLRAFAHQNPEPLHVITSLNAALFDYLPGESFITLAYFVIDGDSHTLSYVNAGHETSIVLRGADHSITEIGPNGPMLGVTASVAYSQSEASFKAGDLLFCYTDGVTDVRTNGERFGYRRLRETIAAAPARDAHGLMDHVMETVRSFGTHRQTDDQVVVVVRPLV